MLVGWWKIKRTQSSFDGHLPVFQKEMKENKERNNFIAVYTFLTVLCVRGGTNEASFSFF